jgi:hypothetical protein
LEILQGKRDKLMQSLIEEHRRMRGNSALEDKGKTMIDVLLSRQEAELEYYTDEIIIGMMQVSFSHFLSIKSEIDPFHFEADGERLFQRENVVFQKKIKWLFY